MVPGVMERVLFDIGERKNFAFLQTRKLLKMLKINEKLLIFETFTEILRFFENF